MNVPSLTAVQIDGDDAPDLTAYSPAYPLRVRLLMQMQEDGVLTAVEMLVFTTLQ